MKQKVFLIFFGIGLALLIAELTLRLSGFGCKVMHRSPQKHTSDYTIFCVGESTTEGSGASDILRKSYPAQLEVLLNKRFPHKRIHCVYDQTIGQNTSEILLKLPTYIKKYDPQLMILMVGTNNWWNLDRSNILLFNKNTHVSQFTLRTLIFLDKFRLWKLIKWIRLSRGRYKERWNYEHSSDIDARANRILKFYNEEIWDVFDKLAEYDISEMLKICRANNIKAVMCSYPMKTIGNLYLIQKKISDDFGISFVDNYAFFQTLPDVEDYLSRDLWHPNDHGYALVANNIYEHILENRLIE